MIATRSWKGLLLATCAALGGCAGMSEGPVPVSQSTSVELEGLRTAIREECLDVSNTTVPQGDQARRNELVTAFMTAADINYNNYERELLAFTRDNDLGGALANQLLSAIGAASGSRAISRATNIASGAVSGTQSAFAKSLLNQTVSVLQTHMRAQRAAQYAIIVTRRAWPYQNWDTCMALSDALAYEQAGTLNAALAAMEASATDEERDGNAEAQQAIERVAFNSGNLARALRGYFLPTDRSLLPARAAKVSALLTAARITVPAGMTPGERLMRVLDGNQPGELRALALALLQSEQEQSARAPIVEALTDNNGG